jgi:lipopolysaccharide assembly outer membrane protein LptD (OstA)
MNTKKIVQFILIIFLLLLSLIFYKKYFQIDNKISENKKETKINNEKIKNAEINEEKKDANIIQNLRYVSEDLLGNTYILSATSAEIIKDDQDNVNLFNVEGEIIQDNGEKIVIISEIAKYNRQNNNTLFKDNVLVLYGIETIKADIVKINFTKNSIEILENVHYTNENLEIFADIVEIDLLKNKLKISMKDQKSKIQISGEN